MSKVIDVTPAELAISALGYDQDFPTKQQETLASIYIRLLYNSNGRHLIIESADISSAVADVNAIASSPLLPVRYQSFLPILFSTICEIIALTADKGQILKEIGVNAIDRLIDHAIRVLFDNLFGEDAPPEEQSGEVAAAIKDIATSLETLKTVIEQEELTVAIDGLYQVLRITNGGTGLE